MAQKPENPEQGAFTAEVAWFFSGCKNPIAVSDVITCLASGNHIEVARTPSELVPAVLLLATIGFHSYDQQIVDDYHTLLEMQIALFKDAWHDVFWHPSLALVSMVCNEGARGNYFLDANPEAGYMFRVYEQLVNLDIERLFQ